MDLLRAFILDFITSQCHIKHARLKAGAECTLQLLDLVTQHLRGDVRLLRNLSKLHSNEAAINTSKAAGDEIFTATTEHLFVSSNFSECAETKNAKSSTLKL